MSGHPTFRDRARFHDAIEMPESRFPGPTLMPAPPPLHASPTATSFSKVTQSEEGPSSPRLDRLFEGFKPERYPITKEVTGLGRDATNDICFGAAGGTSRFHARILRQEDGQFLLADLNSSNGTFLNGVRVFEPALLKNGDQIEIGNAHFAFYL